MLKNSKIKIVAILCLLLLVGWSCSKNIPFLNNEPPKPKEIVNLPDNFDSAVTDIDIDRETSMIMTLATDGKLYREQNEIVSNRVDRKESLIIKEEFFPDKLIIALEGKQPEKRIVYFKCDVNTSFENVLQIFNLIRNAEIDRVGLVVVGKKSEVDSSRILPARFEVKLPAPLESDVFQNRAGEPPPPPTPELPKNKEKKFPKPNPLTLVVEIDKDGKLKLNKEGMGDVFDTLPLASKLVQIFKDREANGVFRENTNEVEKTVFLKVSKSIKYGDFIKLVDAVKGAYAEPIGIQIDDIGF